MSKEQKAKSCPEFVTQDQMIEAEKLIYEMNKSYIQQSTNPELQTQDSADFFLRYRVSRSSPSGQVFHPQ